VLAELEPVTEVKSLFKTTKYSEANYSKVIREANTNNFSVIDNGFQELR
jgi:hypothetical protein